MLACVGWQLKLHVQRRSAQQTGFLFEAFSMSSLSVAESRTASSPTLKGDGRGFQGYECSHRQYQSLCTRRIDLEPRSHHAPLLLTAAFDRGSAASQGPSDPHS